MRVSFGEDIKAGQLALIALQLGLAVLVIGQYQLESRTFYLVAQLILVGFIVHSVLPVSWRLSFFVLLSLLSIVLVLGVRDGIALILVGVGLIGVCHLPIGFKWRVGLLCLLGAGLALSRAGLIMSPWSGLVWAILGSMFMFRLFVYMYALRYDETVFNRTNAFAYFFMIPNVCFPLFPVVDYVTFCKSHYTLDSYDTYARGMKWIVRGIVHLLLYRLVYLRWAVDPSQLETLGDLLQHLISTFLLYLRISGQFHMIVGVLHLFGFRLPETHHLFYLASSFTDFWRRINIYWKDFMMKLFYYPSFFRLRERGNVIALVGATLVVFFGTWILHSYQWFWLRGGFPITAQDGLFWAILGVLVVITAVRESRSVRRPERKSWSATRAIKVSGVFVTICVLWSLWSAESVSEWLAMWRVAPRVERNEALVIAAIVTVGVIIAGQVWDGKRLSGRRERFLFQKPWVHSLTILGGLLVLGLPGGIGGAELTSLVTTLRSNTLNVRDAELQHRGYYEKLDNASRLSAELWNVQSQRPPNWVEFKRTDLYRTRDDFLLEDMQPSMRTILWDQPFTTNHWGMRDQEYVLEKPPGTVRIAILGPSHVMGIGVGDGETFEAILEKTLNEEEGNRGMYRYEVLNFGIAAYSLTQQMAILEDRVLAFDPDVVVVTLPADRRVNSAVVLHLRSVLSQGIPIPYQELRSILSSYEIKPGSENNTGTRLGIFLGRVLKRVVPSNFKLDKAFESDLEDRLRLASERVVEWSLQRIASTSKVNGAIPVVLGLDVVKGRTPDDTAALQRAERLGIVTIDLFDVFDGRATELQLGAWDEHPNALGHRVIAERLYVELMQRDAQLQLGFSSRAMVSSETVGADLTLEE